VTIANKHVFSRPSLANERVGWARARCPFPKESGAPIVFSFFHLQLFPSLLKFSQSNAPLHAPIITAPKSGADLRVTMPPKSVYAEKRLQLFAKKQLPEEQRLANRADLELESQKAFGHSTKYQHSSAKVWFQEFMENCLPDQDDEEYFRTRGPIKYPNSVFKAYAVFLA
jgi:hypothetical protein